MSIQQNSNRKIVPQFGLAMILFATFLPAGLKAVGGAIASMPGIPEGVGISVYLGLEAIFFLAILYLFGRDKGSFRFNFAIPYQAKVSPVLFLVLLFAVTAYAIYFRDFFRWAPLTEFAGYVRETLTFWPPDWLQRPGFSFQDPNASLSTRIATLSLGVVAIGAASAMQTIYFRGFLLPRMEYLGWLAPVLNTALFAMFHIYSPAFWHLFFIFTLGWGVVAYATRNVWIVAVSHVIFNTYGLLLAIYATVNTSP